jgi:hypothetical protein
MLLVVTSNTCLLYRPPTLTDMRLPSATVDGLVKFAMSGSLPTGVGLWQFVRHNLPHVAVGDMPSTVAGKRRGSRVPANAVHIIDHMLDMNPVTRWTAAQALEYYKAHPIEPAST